MQTQQKKKKVYDQHKFSLFSSSEDEDEDGSESGPARPIQPLVDQDFDIDDEPSFDDDFNSPDLLPPSSDPKRSFASYANWLAKKD